MSRYIVDVKGCDGETIFTIDLTDVEAAGVRKVAELSQATSQYACYPVVELHLYDDPGADLLRRYLASKEEEPG